MKKLYILFSLAVCLSGCQNDLLDTFPYDQASGGNMWTTENLADQGVVGIYNGLRGSSVGKDLYQFEALGVSGNWRDNSTDANKLLTDQVSPGASFFSDYWKEHYELISRANDAIANLPKAPLSEQKLNRLTNESKFLRAFGYYKLNMVYKGVPLYLEPTELNGFTKARESEETIWQAVVSDLTDCINSVDLPDRYETGDLSFGRITKSAAYALRGKVYLWTKEYANAENDFKKVGALGHELFKGKYADLFIENNEQSKEMIFSLQCMNVSGYGHSMSFRYGTRVTDGSCWNSVLPNADFINTYERVDGSKFNWDDFLPGYNTMNPQARAVYFLRDNLTGEEISTLSGKGMDMSKYLPTGNEARLLKAYEDRDTRLKATYITPYSEYYGTNGSLPFSYTLRWPYRGFDSEVPFDLRTDTNTFFYYLFRKFVGLGKPAYINRDNSPIDLPLIRYADVLLGLAEALNEQGKTAEAIQYINLVRERAGIALLNSNSNTQVVGKDDLRMRIMNERRWEFAGEGSTVFDEIRCETWKDVKFFEGASIKEIWGSKTTYEYVWNDRIYKWAIPNSEVQMNTNLTQNPGWEN